VSASLDKTVCVWDVAKRRQRTVLTGHSNRVYCPALSPKDKVLAAAGDDGIIRVWASGSGRLLRQFGRPKESVYALVFTPKRSFAN